MSNRDLFRVYDVHATAESANPSKFRTPGIDRLHKKYPRKRCENVSTLNLT